MGPFEGSKPRQVLINKEQWQEMKFRQGGTVPTISADAPAAPLDGLPPFDVEEAMDAAREDTL